MPLRAPAFLDRRLAVLTLGHFTIDSYSSFFLPLLPLLAARLQLNYAMIGGLTALASLASSFSQPLFGLVADRMRRPWFVFAGPLLAAVFMASVGLAPTFMVLLALLLMGGFGVAMFHPQAASLAGGGGADRGMAMSFWITGGTLGWALGPTFATAFVSAFGLDHTWLAAIPGLALSALLVSWFVREAPHASPHAKEHAPLSGLRPVLRPLLLLYGAVVCRSAVSTGFATFLPLWVHANGGSVAMGGLITTLYLTLGALGGFAGGLLAGRFGAHRVVRGSFLVAIPLYAVFFLLAGSHPKWALLPLVLGYAGLQSSLPVNVVLGQQLSPRHAGIISSLLMGAAWGVGSLLTYPVGALADHSGLLVGLLALSGLLLLGLACASSLPSAPARDAA